MKLARAEAKELKLNRPSKEKTNESSRIFLNIL
jgi:hypothetical protein